jgi:hypothetical protein
MPGRNVSAGCSKLCHKAVPFGDRMTRLPVFRSTAARPVAAGEELESPVATLVVQRTRPSASDRTRLEVSVRDSVGAEVVPFVAGASRLATHTAVSLGMSVYHTPRYSLAGAELVGEKKPKAKPPPSETMVVPGRSGLPRTSRSSDAPCGSRTRRTVA